MYDCRLLLLWSWQYFVTSCHVLYMWLPVIYLCQDDRTSLNQKKMPACVSLFYGNTAGFQWMQNHWPVLMQMANEAGDFFANSVHGRCIRFCSQHLPLHFPSVLWHCWLGDWKGNRPVKSWVLVCWWWWFDWSCARLTAPVVTTTSTILSSNQWYFSS